MESLLLWGLALLAAAALLIMVEIFIPSGGLISIVAVILAIVGVVCLFRYDVGWGIGGTAAVLILGPTIAFAALHIWRSTPMGRRAIGAPTEEEIEARHRAEEEDRRRREAMIGLEGVTLTDLRPVGVVEIQGRRHEAVSETAMVARGTPVRVTAVEGNQLKVRALA